MVKPLESKGGLWVFTITNLCFLLALPFFLNKHLPTHIGNGRKNPTFLGKNAWMGAVIYLHPQKPAIRIPIAPGTWWQGMWEAPAAPEAPLAPKEEEAWEFGGLRISRCWRWNHDGYSSWWATQRIFFKMFTPAPTYLGEKGFPIWDSYDFRWVETNHQLVFFWGVMVRWIHGLFLGGFNHHHVIFFGGANSHNPCCRSEISNCRYCKNVQVIIGPHSLWNLWLELNSPRFLPWAGDGWLDAVIILFCGRDGFPQTRPQQMGSGWWTGWWF